jgi:hypothetical protein
MDALIPVAKHNQILIFRVVEYGMKKEYFTIRELVADLELSKDDEHYVNNVIKANGNTSDNINHLIVFVKRGENYEDAYSYTYTLLPNAIVQYIDYLEIVEARKMAEEARKQSINAMNLATQSNKIALFALVASIFLGVVQIIIEALKN